MQSFSIHAMLFSGHQTGKHRDVTAQIRVDPLASICYLAFQGGYQVFLKRCQTKERFESRNNAMMKSTEPEKKPLRGIAALFDDIERKELFKKYLFFLGWIEVLILAICWLYQMGDGGYDRFGPIDVPFPWKTYFLISFLTPVAITFLIGIIVVGFNKYFGEPEAGEHQPGEGGVGMPLDPSGKIHKLNIMVVWLQRLPFLGLLMLLGVTAGFFYKLDSILAFVTAVGEQSVKIFLISIAVLVGLFSIFALILIILNYQLRKRSMSYEYKSQMAERFGLIILDDNTVINSEGKLLVSGKNWKDSVPLLSDGTVPEEPKNEPSPAGALPRPINLKTT
jgi:membrane protein implicated in regulation of membrane protease activity